VQTDRNVPDHKPDIIILDNEKGTYIVINVAICGHRNLIRKEARRVRKHEDLTVEIQRMWNVKTKVIRITTGSTGTIPK